MKKQKRVIFVLDRTGSMLVRKSQTIMSYNEYLSEIRLDPEICFTLVQFSSMGTEVTYKHVPIADVQDLTNANYVLAGMTPLIEAVMKAIAATERVAGADDRIVMTILTDGEENASSAEYTAQALAAKVKAKTEEGWKFVFLGASMDAYAEASKYGIAAGATMSYDSTDIGATKAAFRSTAANTMSFMDGDASFDFTPEQRGAAKDVHDPSLAVQHQETASKTTPLSEDIDLS